MDARFKCHVRRDAKLCGNAGDETEGHSDDTEEAVTDEPTASGEHLLVPFFVVAIKELYAAFLIGERDTIGAALRLERGIRREILDGRRVRFHARRSCKPSGRHGRFEVVRGRTDVQSASALECWDMDGGGQPARCDASGAVRNVLLTADNVRADSRSLGRQIIARSGQARCICLTEVLRSAGLRAVFRRGVSADSHVVTAVAQWATEQ